MRVPPDSRGMVQVALEADRNRGGGAVCRGTSFKRGGAILAGMCMGIIFGAVLGGYPGDWRALAVVDRSWKGLRKGRMQGRKGEL